MAEPLRHPSPDLLVGRKQMLFAVPVDEDGHETVRFFTENVESLAADDGVRQALSVIGAWSDLDWEQAFEELDRIRHESRPTPPIWISSGYPA
jgi:hypothetical protein